MAPLRNESDNGDIVRLVHGICVRGPQHAKSPTDRIGIVTVEQNGRADKLNLTLFDIRCMLIGSGLPPFFWGEAITYAAHLQTDAPKRYYVGRHH